MNLTDEIVPNNVKYLLAIGPQFAVENNKKIFPLCASLAWLQPCPATPKLIKKRYLKQVEVLIKKAKNKDKNQLRIRHKRAVRADNNTTTRTTKQVTLIVK
ncbi:hypothetical protein CBL_05219 [Carabus blaptoides fortunei]